MKTKRRFRPCLDGLESKLALTGTVTTTVITVVADPIIAGSDDVFLDQSQYTDSSLTADSSQYVVNPLNSSSSSVSLTQPSGYAVISMNVSDSNPIVSVIANGSVNAIPATNAATFQIVGNTLAAMTSAALGTATIPAPAAISPPVNGVITCLFSGTIPKGGIKVGGSLGGTVLAPEDPAAPTPTPVTGTLTGTVSSGNISGIVIGKDLLDVTIAFGSPDPTGYWEEWYYERHPESRPPDCTSPYSTTDPLSPTYIPPWFDDPGRTWF